MIVSKDVDGVAVELRIDPLFTGALRSQEGSPLKGTCVVRTQRPVHLRRLDLSFEGRCKVNVRPATASLGAPSAEGAECRSLICRRVTVDDTFCDAGEHAFPFEFELPATLPASFRGKRGHIRYRLQAAVHWRRRMRRRVRVAHEICIRRCLLVREAALCAHETVHGGEHTDKLRYSASAPPMVYREGGLVPLSLAVAVADPAAHAVHSITCALRERIVYRTTGRQSLTCHAVTATDELFPLGWSTIHPAADDCEYNAVFRMCPRVNADINTRLIRVTHALVVRIVVVQQHQQHQQRSMQRTSSASSLRTLSEDLVASFRQRRQRSDSHLPHHDHAEPPSYTCTLECPLIVTCREHYWEGDRPHPPAYQDTEAPPSYGLAVEQLPPVPCYPEE